LINVVNFLAADFAFAERDFTIHKAGSGDAPQVKDDFEQFVVMIGFMNGLNNAFRQDAQQGIEVIGNSALVTHHRYSSISCGAHGLATAFQNFDKRERTPKDTGLPTSQVFLPGA
jgi:hypothetical protein